MAITNKEVRKIKNRTNNSIINAIIAIITNIVTILMTFIMQTVLIKVLGSEYNGLNGLFTNIISMLSMVELGIGPAIIFNLYKPISNNDIPKIKSLMKFYKNCYHIIGIAILILGIIMLPFLENIVGKNSLPINIYIVFILFIIETFSSYMISYKRSILYANQESYITNLVHILCIIAMNIIQILFMVITKNYYLVVIARIIFKIIENVIITIIANKKYSYIKDKNVEKLDKKVVYDIKQKVKGSIFHNIGANVVLSTDNIIISSFLGIEVLGKYVNYNMIIKSISNLLAQMFSSITASIGNLLIDTKENKSYSIYKKINFLNFWIYSYIAIAIYCVINPFITFWIGEEYLLSNNVLIALIFNFFLQGMRQTIATFRSAAGICYEDRYIPIIESIINIVFSITLVKLFGLVGVFIGTIISTLFVHLYSYPKYVYTKIFNKKFRDYNIELGKYTGLFCIIWLTTVIIYKTINLENIFLQIIWAVIISFILPNVVLYICYRKKEEYKYFKELIISKVRRKKYDT